MISEGSSVQKAFARWDHSRVPCWLFQRPDVFLPEQRRLFRGPTWHYLGLEVEVANPGDYLTTRVGNTPVILVRETDAERYGFENR